ncbi:MAG: molybdopterin converting factor subunit 1 [Bacteroidota bacterium]|nr:molybdopterin converting factor subunit 1 [Bacteroidota bacterium]
MTDYKILLFGITREIIGDRQITLQSPAQAKVKDLLNQLKEDYPALKKLKSLVIAVNDEYAQETHELADNDEIALIPPVSGG